MPESRKRPGHHPHKEPPLIPRSQRVRGRVLWAILFGVFAVLIAYFGAGNNYLILSLAAIVGALLGYTAGRSMEKDV